MRKMGQDFVTSFKDDSLSQKRLKEAQNNYHCKDLFTFFNLLSQLVLNVWMLGKKVEHEAGGVRGRVNAGQEHVGHQRQDVLLVQA